MTSDLSGYDLGGGHSFVWLYAGGEAAPGQLIGLIEHHPNRRVEGHRDAALCGGYIAWIDDPHSGTVAKHQLVAGEPGGERHLTVHPSLLCPRCGNHGFIRKGRWVDA